MSSDKELLDVAAERAVLSGLCQHGLDAFLDTEDVLTPDSFVVESNQIFYKCIKEVLSESSSVDASSILASASKLGFNDHVSKKKEMDYLRSIFNFPIHLENVRRHAIKLRKLEIAREVKKRLIQCQSDIVNVNGEARIDEIIAIAENPIFELTALLNRGREDKPVLLGDLVDEYLTDLEENPAEMIGVSTGFARFDHAIGGGLRRKCVDLVAARPKVGKSMFGDSVALHVSGELNIPVLMLDTEMSKEDHFNRILANLSGVSINDIASGKFVKNPVAKEKVKQAAEKFKEMPYDYISIAGMPFEQTLSMMRRWILQRVGVDENGRTKNCLIVYDYLKLMSSESVNRNLQEFQVLGFQITSLHNFCVQYDCPCLSFVQLNRDGITRESTDVVSGSDRLIWLCTSFTIFKKKSDEEIAEDGDDIGNRKLVPVVARHGAGLEDGDYINISMKGDIARIKENKTRNEIKKSRRSEEQGFEHDASSVQSA